MKNKRWLAVGAAIIVLLAIRTCADKGKPKRVLKLGTMPVITEGDIHYGEKEAGALLKPLEQIRREADEKLEKYR